MISQNTKKASRTVNSYRNKGIMLFIYFYCFCSAFSCITKINRQAQIAVLLSSDEKCLKNEHNKRGPKKKHVEGVIFVGQCQGWMAAALMSAFIQAFSEQARDTFLYMCRCTLEFAWEKHFPVRFFFPTRSLYGWRPFLLTLHRCHTRSQRMFDCSTYIYHSFHWLTFIPCNVQISIKFDDFFFLSFSSMCLWQQLAVDRRKKWNFF